MKEELSSRKIKRQRILFGSAIAGFIFLSISSNYGTPNIFKWSKIDKENFQREQSRINYEIKLDSLYDNLLKKLPTFEDSLNFYLKQRLPIYLKEPSLEQKEEVIKENNLGKYLEGQL